MKRNNWILILAVALAGIFNVASHARAADAAANSDFFASFAFDSKAKTQWVRSIAIDSPAYCSEINGDTRIEFKAPGMTTVRVFCWQQPTGANNDAWGHDQELAPDLKLGDDGAGSFVFHADQFPNGPINVRFYAKDDSNKQDFCELQLFNKGGVVWKQGAPKANPPAAQGMKLAFDDEFTGPLSIAKDGSKTYWTHWGGGDGSVWPFTDYESPNNPFSQVDGKTKKYLRIHASKPPGSNGATGTLTTVDPHSDYPGITVHAPCYLECRFLAQNAQGNWPAFWTVTVDKTPRAACDELDVIEAYGTNSRTGGIWTPYHCTSHFWGQSLPEWAMNHERGPDGNPYQAHRLVPTTEIGSKTGWSTTFHTYGLLVTKQYTAYYLDNVEVLRHPSGKLSATLPIAPLVNLAVGGGGWTPDLRRYGNQSDMWVDYLRMYQGE
ncbi:MAG TPA: family 16 glycosylhydrolase [Tepidisphaeraceae bacterium]|jgi:hypothetical protein|nr:family 16 glycosylhydrolase [Tepidisphaeraceae bacterium]